MSGKQWNIEAIYLIGDKTYSRRFTLNGITLQYILDRVQGQTVTKEAKKRVKLKQSTTYHQALNYVKDNIEFVCFNEYTNNFEKLINEHQPFYL